MSNIIKSGNLSVFRLETEDVDAAVEKVVKGRCCEGWRSN